jgi:hypothetical protein
VLFKISSGFMANSIWNFMEIECPGYIKRLLGISVIAEAVLSEPFFMPVMTVTPYSPFPAAVETDIVQPVSRIKRINGYINK